MADQEPAPKRDQRPDDDEPVPRLPRRFSPRKRTYFPPGEIITIFALLIGLFAVLSLKDSCAAGVENLFRAFEVPDAGPNAAPAVPRP